MPASPSLGRKLGYAVLATLLGLGLVEATCAVLERTVLTYSRTLPTPQPGREGWPQLQVPEGTHLAMVEDATKRWGLAPGSIQVVGNTEHQINSLGLRGPEVGPRPPGEVRLFTLGDSSIYGDGVSLAGVFSHVAAIQLGEAWGCTVRDVIGAVPGYDTNQSLQRLEEVGAAVDPQWVIVGAMWSDMFKDNGFDRTDFVDFAALRSPMRRFATWRVARTLLAPALTSRRVRFIASSADIPDLGAGERGRVLLARYVENLRALEARARTLGARTAFLALPAPSDLDRAQPPETILEYRAAMRLVAEETGSPYVDGATWLRAEGVGVGAFADQVHPNALGHALLGHALAETLKVEPAPAGCTATP